MYKSGLRKTFSLSVFSLLKQFEACIRTTKARVSTPQRGSVRVSFLPWIGVPEALPCPVESQPQGLSARAQLIAHLLSRLPPGLPSHSLIQPAGRPASIHRTISFAPNWPRPQEIHLHQKNQQPNVHSV